MDSVKILIKGYAKALPSGGWVASSSTTLITTSKNLRIVVDPGCNRELLFGKLKREKLAPGDIDYVFMTHYHPDHVLLASIFTKAKIFDADVIYEADRETSYSGELPNTDIGVLLTPGHTHEHASLLVTTRQGQVAVAGDVFWWKDEEKQRIDGASLLSHKDPFVKDQKALFESRKKLLALANWIIPGHGKVFRVVR